MTIKQKRSVVEAFKAGGSTGSIASKLWPVTSVNLTGFDFTAIFENQLLVERTIRDFMLGKFSLKVKRRGK